MILLAFVAAALAESFPDCLAGACIGAQAKPSPSVGMIMDREFDVKTKACAGTVVEITATRAFTTAPMNTGSRTIVSDPSAAWLAGSLRAIIEATMKIELGWKQVGAEKFGEPSQGWSTEVTKFTRRESPGITRTVMFTSDRDIYQVSVTSTNSVADAQCRGGKSASGL